MMPLRRKTRKRAARGPRPWSALFFVIFCIVPTPERQGRWQPGPPIAVHGLYDGEQRTYDLRLKIKFKLSSQFL